MSNWIDINKTANTTPTSVSKDANGGWTLKNESNLSVASTFDAAVFDTNTFDVGVTQTIQWTNKPKS